MRSWMKTCWIPVRVCNLSDPKQKPQLQHRYLQTKLISNQKTQMHQNTNASKQKNHRTDFYFSSRMKFKKSFLKNSF
jgi:hypothetical protein